MSTPMQDIQKLNDIFFKAKKTYIPTVKQYTVEGYPGSSQDPVFYETYQNDWFFRTYKEVIFSGLLWTRKLFNSSLRDLRIKHLEYGRRKKRWFNIQVVQTDSAILIDGEKHYPFINISYSYDAVHSIRFELGFYRYACSNGWVIGLKELAKFTLKPENIFHFPFWLNPCLINYLSNRYQYQVQVLKRTRFTEEAIMNFVSKNFKNWKISGDVFDRYLGDEEIGYTGYGLINILTDAASNFDDGFSSNQLMENPEVESSGNSERAIRQRKIGLFLDRLIGEIEKENKVKQIIDINSDDFHLTDENLDILETYVLREEYSFNLGKFKL